MSVPQSEAFKKATVDSKKLTSKPSNDDLLQLYGKRVFVPPKAASQIASRPGRILTSANSRGHID